MLAGAALASALGVWGFGAAKGLDASAPAAAYPTRAQLLDFSYIVDEYGRRAAADARLGAATGLVLGSSELYPPAGMPEHPVELLVPGHSDVDVMALGRPNCECLWQAIEAGALASSDAPARIVLIPSLIWFSVARRPAQEWPATFSQGAYDAFMSNPRISAALKDRVTKRLAAYNVDARVAGPSLEGVAAGVDAAVTKGVQTARRLFAPAGSGLPVAGVAVKGSDAVEDGRGATSEAGEPDWSSLYAGALAEDARSCASNPWGVFDTWAQEGLSDFWRRASEWDEHEDDDLSPQELDDFEMALEAVSYTHLPSPRD